MLVAGGTLSVALGVLGMFLPLLPTTPFLLLAAYCYARSSKKFHHWLMTNRWCGEYLRNYQEGRSITLKHKILTISLLWLSMSYSAIVVVSQWWVKVILFLIAAGVTVHLVRMKTVKVPAQRSALLREYVPPENPI